MDTLTPYGFDCILQRLRIPDSHVCPHCGCSSASPTKREKELKAVDAAAKIFAELYGPALRELAKS